jgi:UrcA family protein
MPRLNLNRSALVGAAMAAGLAGVAAPALAQTTVESLTITGHWRVGDNVRELSAAVPYDDLDLNTGLGRDVFRERVRATARDLCERLGEPSTAAPPLNRSCEQEAMDNARKQIRIAIASQRMPVYAYLPPDEPYVAPVGPTADTATGYGADVSAVAPTYVGPSVTTGTVTNPPAPDTTANRYLYGGPMSYGGRATTPSGN